MTATRRKLTPRQQLFCREYLIDLNGTKAAIRAGYAKRTAQPASARLLTNVMVLAEIRRLNAKRIQRLGITIDWVLRELALMGFANMLDYIRIDRSGAAAVDLSRLDRDRAAAIMEIVVEECIDPPAPGEGYRKMRRTTLRLRDKLAALEDLGKHLKLFTDRKSLSAATLETR